MRFYSITLQNQLKEDKMMIKNSPNIIIAADKTGSFCEMDPDNYKKFLRDNITKDYQRDDIT